MKLFLNVVNLTKILKYFSRHEYNEFAILVIKNLLYGLSE